MKLWEKFTGWWSADIKNRIILLAACGTVAVATGVLAVCGLLRPVQVETVQQIISETVTKIKVVSSATTSFPSLQLNSGSGSGSGSDTVERVEEQPVELFLKISSATQDLNVNIVDKSGAVVRNVKFMLRVQGLDKENADYDKTFAIDSLDGNLYLSWIPAGNYKFTLQEQEGFTVPESSFFKVAEFKVVYQKIEDISEKIVDEKEVEVRKEDSQYGEQQAAEKKEDTVEYVPANEEKKEQPVTDDKGNTQYTYTYQTGTGAFGMPCLLLVDGSVSDVEPVEENGTLSYGVRYVADTVVQSGELSAPRGPESGGYTVVFVNADGTTLSSVTVEQGGTATPPEVPSMTGENKRYVFTGWSSDTTNVTANMTVSAVYQVYKAEKVTLIQQDGTPVAGYQITVGEKTEKITVYTGWQTIDGKTYYYDVNHNKVTGWQIIQGVTYYFDSNGVRSDCMGIDVSRWNETIDWAKVKAAGISFVIIRVGYRGYGTGALVEDSMARTNLAGASAAGLKIGAYVFSQAVDQQEAVEEASMAVEMVKGYALSYPIYFDTEYSTSAKDGRADALSVAQRTAIAQAFCKTVVNSGYLAGVYASKSWFMNQLNVSELSAYHFWLAHYTTQTDYTGRYEVWQYSSTGSVDGISGGVDMNISFHNY